MNEIKFLLEVQVHIRKGNEYPGLSISEVLEIPALDFLECAKILGLFHDLAQTLKAKKEQAK